MKEVDLTKQIKAGQGGDWLQKTQDFLVGALSQVGITLESEGNAAEVISRQFGRLLDNRYTMLKTVDLPGTPRPVPLILVGPPGVFVVNPRGESGVFRAREDSWVEMNQRTQKYEVGRENLMEQTQAYAQTVETFLREKGFTVTSVQPLLIFANPGVHIESSRPIVRILPIDALERYIATLAQSQQVISVEENVALVESLSAPPPPPPVETPEVKPEPKKSAPPLSGQMNLPPALAKMNFTSQQWMIVGVLVFFEIVLLILLIIIVLMQS